MDVRESVAVAPGVKDFTSDGRIPMVLDGVIGPSGQKFGNVRPLIAVLGVSRKDDLVLVACPRRLSNAWVEMVVPPFPTLFTDAAW